MSGSLLTAATHLVIASAVLVRVLIRPHRDPSSRVAWIVVTLTIPFLGAVAYLLLGETGIGRRRVTKMREVLASLPAPGGQTDTEAATAETGAQYSEYQPLFDLGRSISHFPPVAGNRADLMADSDATINSMVADIDAATDHVHILFYIWLTDHNGCKVADALCRAASRGVTCRAMVDGLGSRAMLHSETWQQMKQSGVRLGVALEIGNPLLRVIQGRIDLRNHRKILVVDGRVAYCGSQNCADPEFRVKPKFAPWVDAVMRFEGPVVRQCQYVFASDWMTYVDEDIHSLLGVDAASEDLPATQARGFTCQVVATGPTVRFSAMPEMFAALIYSARQELIITTPYYVPNDSLQDAICSAAYRGVDTKIIFPARNDSWIVGAASRSYYADLLDAGVKIHEYHGGLLHTKSLTMDGEVTLIGSANMDRRSFELNYENNILLVDTDLTAQMRQRQQEYLAHTSVVTDEQVAAWPLHRRLWNNAIAMLGPIL